MSDVAAVSVVIPTYNRAASLLSTLEAIQRTNPRPAEIIVHIDGGDASLAEVLGVRFPAVIVLSSETRIGPGGGRQRALSVARSAISVSFDDDSYPVDKEFFSTVVELFNRVPEASIIGATIWHRNQSPIAMSDDFERVASFVGCGVAIRMSDFGKIRGYLPLQVAYGMEESDIAFQMYISDMRIYRSGALRAFHDTELKHHSDPVITAGTISNVALFAYLHYSMWGIPIGLGQVANAIRFAMKSGRYKGILRGLFGIPMLCSTFNGFRQPQPYLCVREFLKFRKEGVPRSFGRRQSS